MFRLFRSRLVWLTIGVLTLTGTAFWIVVAAVATVMTTAAGGSDPDPDELAQVAMPLGMLAATSTAVFGITVVVVIQRGRARQWVPLREQMVRDAATLPGTHLAQVVSRANPAAGGQVLARDLITGYQGALWLPGWIPPRGAVLCFTATPRGAQVRAWMTARLWRTTSHEADRISRRARSAFARTERERQRADDRMIREAGKDLVVEAEQILRQRNRS
jgi:hypothetical protein